MPSQVEHYSHFMLRITRTAAERAGTQAELAGVVEHLGTGEKRPFASGAELLLLVGAWCGRVPAPPIAPRPEPGDSGRPPLSHPHP